MKSTPEKKPKKSKVGRPTVFTEEVIRKIEEVAALDGSIREMAYYAGIHPDSIYAKMAEDKAFSDRIEALRERPILKARQSIVKALDDPHMALKYLERKRRKEWGDNLDLTTKGEALNVTDLIAAKLGRNRPTSRENKE